MWCGGHWSACRAHVVAFLVLGAGNFSESCREHERRELAVQPLSVLARCAGQPVQSSLASWRAAALPRGSWPDAPHWWTQGA
jgi:hypothetical protein